jgi:hypothetical protein
MKTTSNGRQPKNMKGGISQQPLVGYYSNSKLLEFETKANRIKSECAKVSNKDDLQWKTTTNRRRAEQRVEREQTRD